MIINLKTCIYCSINTFNRDIYLQTGQFYLLNLNCYKNNKLASQRFIKAMNKVKDIELPRILQSDKFTDKLSDISLNKTSVRENQCILNERYNFPASKKLADTHKKASKFGGHQFSKSGKCGCCLNDFQKKQFSIFQRTMPKNIHIKQQKEKADQYFDSSFTFSMNSGASMFFFFVKMTILYLILHSGIVQAYNIITNIQASSTSNATMWINLSIINKMQNFEDIYIVQILSLVGVVCSIGLVIILHKIRYLIWKKIDISRQTEDDYAVFVENIPIIRQKGTKISDMKLDYDAELQRFFISKIDAWIKNSSNWENPSVGTIQHDYLHKTKGPDVTPSDTVKSISLCYDITSLQRLRQLRKQLMEQHQRNYSKLISKSTRLNSKDRYNLSASDYEKKKKRRDQIQIIPQQIHALNESEMALSKQMSLSHSFTHEVCQFLGSGFVCFKYQHYRDYIIQLAETSPDQMKFEGGLLKVSQAFHPSQVLWENLALSDSDRTKRKIVSVLVISLVLLAAFGILLGIYLGSYLLEDILSETLTLIINITSTIIILIIGYILQLIIYQLVLWQSHKTITNAKFSLVKKLVAFQFFNNALLYYIIFQIRGGNLQNMDQKSGIVNRVSWLLVISASLQIIFNLLNIGDLYHRAYIWWYYRSSQDQISEFQINVNKIFELVQFDIAQRYSYYIVQTFTAMFYAYLVPIGIPTLSAVFIIQYWIEKFNLFKRSSMKYVANYSLSKKIFKMLELSILVYSVGMLIFSTKINGEIQIFPTISVGISCLYLLLSFGLPTKIGKIYFQSYVQLEQNTYDQNARAGKFSNTYWNTNPVTALLNQNAATHRKSITDQAKLKNEKRLLGFSRKKQGTQFDSSLDYQFFYKSEI